MDTSLSEAGRILSQAASVVITTHVQADGDGLGAEKALYHYLKRAGKQVQILNPDPVPERYHFLDKKNVVEIYKPKQKAKKFDLGIIMDTHDPKRIGPVWDYFRKNAKAVIVFDHHPNLHRDEIPSDVKLHSVVDEKSSSIGELMYRLFHLSHDFFGFPETVFKLTPEIALGLYVSIITDTNSFRYARTTALSHRIAAELLDFGMEPESIYQEIYSSKKIAHLRLIGEVLAEVQSDPSERIAWVTIGKKQRHDSGASSDDTQSIVNFLLLLKSADVLVLFREEDDGRVKISMKSKGKTKVHQIAQEFGGGGHEFAAGFSTKEEIRSVQRKLIARIQKEFRS